MGKRIGLFIAVNLLVVATISIVTSVLGLQPYITAYGIDYGSLMIFCLLWGFGGAFISLALSKVMAKWLSGVKIIDPHNSEPEARWLVHTVTDLAMKAGLPKTPEVGFFESPEVNAFATGPSRSNALVAVSTGLLRTMNKTEAEGVIAHEISHIANGDMVTMTLLQGVVNAFVMFFARIIAFAVSQYVEGNRRYMVRYALVFVFEMLFGFLGMFVITYFSRQREFRADAGGARLAGRQKMISALQSLQRNVYGGPPPEGSNNPSLSTLKISSGKNKGLMSFLSTHPSLEERIARLQA